MKINKLNQGLLREEAGEGSSGGGGGAPTSTLGGAVGSGGTQTVAIPENWNQALPEDIRNDPSMKDFKPNADGFVNLAKTHINSQKLIGKNRIALPGQNATPEEKAAFYNSIGRPQTPDDYKITLPETLKNVTPDEEGLKQWKGFLHEQGLTNEQANNLIAKYYEDTDGALTARQAQIEAQQAEGINKLKDEWGDNFDQNSAIAAGVVRKFGGEELQKYMDESGMGNNPALIGLFHNIGRAMLDDNAAGGSSDILVTDQTQAKQEINGLKADKEFINALTDKTAVGHKEAKARWDDLHKVAFSTKKS